ncbi:hypothetical protein OG21DRAFT_1526052, partial [Imleria badia]
MRVVCGLGREGVDEHVRAREAESAAVGGRWRATERAVAGRFLGRAGILGTIVDVESGLFSTVRDDGKLIFVSPVEPLSIVLHEFPRARNPLVTSLAGLPQRQLVPRHIGGGLLPHHVLLYIGAKLVMHMRNKPGRCEADGDGDPPNVDLLSNAPAEPINLIWMTHLHRKVQSSMPSPWCRQVLPGGFYFGGASKGETRPTPTLASVAEVAVTTLDKKERTVVAPLGKRKILHDFITNATFAIGKEDDDQDPVQIFFHDWLSLLNRKSKLVPLSPGVKRVILIRLSSCAPDFVRGHPARLKGLRWVANARYYDHHGVTATVSFPVRLCPLFPFRALILIVESHRMWLAENAGTPKTQGSKMGLSSNHAKASRKSTYHHRGNMLGARMSWFLSPSFLPQTNKTSCFLLHLEWKSSLFFAHRPVLARPTRQRFTTLDELEKYRDEETDENEFGFGARCMGHQIPIMTSGIKVTPPVRPVQSLGARKRFALSPDPHASSPPSPALTTTPTPTRNGPSILTRVESKLPDGPQCFAVKTSTTIHAVESHDIIKE